MKKSDFCYIRSFGKIKNIPLYKNLTIHFIVSILLTIAFFVCGPTKGNQEKILKAVTTTEELNDQNFEKVLDQQEKTNQKIDDLSKNEKKRYAFKGELLLISGGSIDVSTFNPEVKSYKQLEKLYQNEKFEDLIAFATNQINKNVIWYTPYYFRGFAYANTGDYPKAIKDLEYFVTNAPLDMCHPKFAPHAKKTIDELKKISS